MWWASPTVVGVLALIHPRVGSRGPGGSWVWGCWVEHNGAAGTCGLTRCWVLRRHPGGCVLRPSRVRSSNARVVWVVVVVGPGCGCVLSVA